MVVFTVMSVPSVAQGAPLDGPGAAPPSSSEATPSAVQILSAAGLSDAQVRLQIEHPEQTAQFTTTFSVSPNLRLVDVAGESAIALGPGHYAVPVAGAAAACGWAITDHDGSAFGQRTARLTLRSDFCWANGAVQGTPTITHRSSVTLYGSAGGWRVAGSTDGARGWIGTGRRQYKAEAKAAWTLQFCVPPVGPCREVAAGTAYARHYLHGNGTVAKEQGGWP